MSFISSENSQPLFVFQILTLLHAFSSLPLGTKFNMLELLNVSSMSLISLFNFLKDFIYLFSERRAGREKERKRNINWSPPSVLSTWDQDRIWNPQLRHLPCPRNPASDPLPCRRMPNQLSHILQGSLISL